MLLENKVVLVTGSASGIGLSCAHAFAREGASVVVVDIDEDKARAVVAEMPGPALAITCDVSDGEAVNRAVATALDRFGRIDAIHNNAGIGAPTKSLDETTEEEWDRLLSVNLKSVYWTTRAALPALKESRGNILSTASLVGLIGQAGHAAYCATKGAMISLTKAMALDYAPFGIRVNAICPAGVWTPMLEDWAAAQEDAADIRNRLDQIHVLGYCPRGDVIADAAVFLLSDCARFITGCILPVSGGAELGYRR